MLTTHPTTYHNIKLNQKGGRTQLFKEQLRIYATFGQKPACIGGFFPKTFIYTRLLAKNPRMYANFIQKPMYTRKKVVKRRKRFKHLKGSVNR